MHYEFTKETFILSHIDSIKIMSRVHKDLSTIKKIINNKQSVEGNSYFFNLMYHTTDLSSIDNLLLIM